MTSCSAFKKHVKRLNLDLKKQGIKEIFIHSELAKVFKDFKGRCVYCGINLAPEVARFHWYLPLSKGGRVETENLVIVCNGDADRYRHGRRLRETIPDVNTFGDLVHNLIQSTVTTLKFKSDNNVEAFVWEEKSNRLKRAINNLLEEVINSMHYHPFTDWKVDNFVFEEDKNTIADIVEDMVEAEVTKEIVNKEPLVNATKQLLTTKQYKIVKHENGTDIP